MGEIVLLRHGQTEWSAAGRHTSYTDVPLTEEGERQAGELGAALAGRSFAAVLCSPRRRARDTADLAGLAVTRIDDKGGTAAVIAFVEKSVGDTPAQVRTAKPSRIQFSADLVRQGGTWLVSDLTPVAVVTPEGKEAS